MWFAQHLCSQVLCCSLLSSHRPQESRLLDLYFSPEFKAHYFSMTCILFPGGTRFVPGCVAPLVLVLNQIITLFDLRNMFGCNRV